jgi:hypothetical protein
VTITNLPYDANGNLIESRFAADSILLTNPGAAGRKATAVSIMRVITMLFAAAAALQATTPRPPNASPADAAAVGRQNAAPQPARTRPPGEDWVQLFNGKDLTGWVNVGKEKWEVEDGTLHGLAITREYGYLQTDKSYKDFHLALRFKCEGDGNSGVFFHVNFKPGTPEVTRGPQFEIDCTLGRHTGGVYEQKRHWIVWPSPENESVVRPGDWNDYLLQVDGNHYISRLNGVTMIDYTDPQPESDDGPLALQLHSGGQGNMRFRDIIVRDLSKR